jgi:hypothetical protein
MEEEGRQGRRARTEREQESGKGVGCREGGRCVPLKVGLLGGG